MKKLKFMTLSLCLSLILNLMALPAMATEVAPAETSQSYLDMVPEATEPEFGTVCVKQGCRTVEGMVPLGGSDKRLDTAQAAFLYEVNTGTVVYSFNPDMKMAPGNLTKLVNAVVALQYVKLDTKVTLNSQIYRLPSGSHHSGLKPDEELTVQDLVHCMLLYSANDAAVGLAIGASGTLQNHAMRMNAWVESIGCTGTNFTNVHGLDTTECTTTARDMVKIYLAAIQNEDIKTILGTSSYTKPANNENEEFQFRTHNYMMDEGIIQDFYDDRVIGGMQSYNKVYGASAVIMAESESKNLKYIGVILNATRVTQPDKEWVVITYGNFNEMTDLLKLAFDNYKNKRIIYDGMALSQFNVAGGECNVVGEARIDVDSVVPVNAHMDNLIMSFDVAGGGLKAPVKAGDQIATMEISYRGSVMAEAEVYSMGNVQPAGKNGVTIHATQTRSSSGDGGIMSVIGTICVIGFGIAAVYLAFNAYMKNRIRARRRKRRAARRRNY